MNTEKVLPKRPPRSRSHFASPTGKKFSLKDHGPDATGGLKNKDEAQQMLEQASNMLSELQEKLYAQDRWAVLLIFQGMDAAGKDGVIKHVMSGVNPQGCDVWSFKAPSHEELDHDYLWRCHKARARARQNRHFQPLLLRGSTGGARASRACCNNQKLPASALTKKIWEERYEDINALNDTWLATASW